MGIRAGLSLHEAWRLSPKSISLYVRARKEAALDHLEMLTAAGYSTAAFTRVSRLDNDTFQAHMPKRRQNRREFDELDRLDNFVHLYNLQFAAKQAKKVRDA